MYIQDNKKDSMYHVECPTVEFHFCTFVLVFLKIFSHVEPLRVSESYYYLFFFLCGREGGGGGIQGINCYFP